MNVYGGDADVCPKCGYIQTTPPKEIYYLYPGTMLQNRYVIGTVVGVGGFGVVYRAWDNNLGKMVAIKEYYPASLVSRAPGTKKVYIYAKKREQEYRNGLVRFLEEARNMAKFSTHKNIVNVFNFFEENGTAYCVMEFIVGVSYKDYIKSCSGIVPEDKALEITMAVLDALRDIHKEGIIHRDIAPDNVMILEDGTIKLMDFGAARFSTGDEEKDLTVILKPGFAPTEQYQSHSKQGPYTDLYAVGAMLYRALTGVMPEESTNRKPDDCLIAPKELNPEISEKLNNVILRAMAMQPELRFQSVDEFKEALIGKKDVRNAQQEFKRRKMLRFVGIASILVILLTAGGIGGLIYGKQKSEVDLRAANIKLWVSYSVDSLGVPKNQNLVGLANDQYDVQQKYQSIIDGFREEYPQIQIDLTIINEKDYADRLNAVIGTEDMPTIFESTGLNETQTANAADLNKIWKWLDTNAYYGLSDYQKQATTMKRLPITFEMPVVYVNTYLYPDYQRVSIKMDSDPYQAENNGLPDFLAGEKECIYASTRNYADVQRFMSGKYAVQKAVGNDDARYSTFFSISNKASTAQKNAGYQFLVYLLSENAQYHLCVEKELNGLNNAINKYERLPLNKNMYELYTGTNSEFMDLIKENESVTISE